MRANKFTGKSDGVRNYFSEKYQTWAISEENETGCFQ